MKPIYRCDFCASTGTEEEMYEHEVYCEANPNRKSCMYCDHKKIVLHPELSYKCDIKEVPDGKQYINCDSFVLKPGNLFNTNDILFGSLFGKH